MKRLTTIVILALICFAVGATNASIDNVAKKGKKNKKAAKTETIQITTNIWGLELAKSNRQQVIDTLTAKGYKVDTEKYSGVVSIENTELTFGPFTWNFAYFRFENDILMDVWFYTNNFDSYNSTLAQYDGIKAKLDSKYATLYDKDAKFINAVKLDSYVDKNTRLSLILVSNQDSHSFTVILNYANIELVKKSGMKGLNEL